MSYINGFVSPDGSGVLLFPFHSCLKGLESKILFRDEEDYEVYVKMIFICAKRTGVTVVMYGVVSNHSHECILSDTLERARIFGEKLKVMYSKYYHNKYKEEGVLKRVKVTTLSIDTDWYLRNVLAYIIRNALDNGAKNISDYKWTGYRALFRSGKIDGRTRKVRDLSKRDAERIMHTGENLKNVPWLINEKNELEPASCCNWRLVEKIFNNDQAYLMRMIGQVNSSEMNEKLVDAPRTMRSDNEFLKNASDICQRWFGENPAKLSTEKKARIIPYIYRTTHTTVSQLARTFEIERERVEMFINGKR